MKGGEKIYKPCLYCGNGLRGRTDKKFCNDVCRNNYHNQLQKQPLHVKEINQALMRNRQIILHLLENNHTLIYNRKSLLNFGFLPGIFTGLQYKPGKQIRYYCYETGFMEIGDSAYLLFAKEPD